MKWIPYRWEDAVEPIWLPAMYAAVRLRNSFILQPGTAADFNWTPSNVPSDFMREKQNPSEPFRRVVAELGIVDLHGDWPKALALAAHLAMYAQDKGRLQSDLFNTYLGIKNGFGYCADYVRVYLALAHTAGLFARQWSFSFKNFGGGGHVVAEVYDRQRDRWLFLDVYNNFHAVSAATGKPLSALEFRSYVLERPGSVDIRPNGPGRPGFVSTTKLIEYYRRGTAEWQLSWGNAVFSYESNYFIRYLGKISPALTRFAGMLLGLQPPFRVLVTAENRLALTRLLRIGQTLRMLGLLVLVVGIVIVLGTLS